MASRGVEAVAVPERTPVTRWFGPGFAELHPSLQALHRTGGKLRGMATFWFAPGSAGWFGRRLARHLGIPEVAGDHPMEIDISHDGGSMTWSRRFGDSQQLPSIFRPIGWWPDGHWLEGTGSFEFKLTVSVVDGGWHWHIIGARLHGIPLPRWLLPRVKAYKRIESGKYLFYVGFALPLMGDVFGYSGLLDIATDR